MPILERRNKQQATSSDPMRSKPSQRVSSFNSPGLAGSMPDGSLFTAANSGVQKKVRRTSSPSQVVHSATQPTKVAGKLRRAVRSSRFAGILGGRHMECAYYFDFCRLCPLSLRRAWEVRCSSFISRIFRFALLNLID